MPSLLGTATGGGLWPELPVLMLLPGLLEDRGGGAGLLLIPRGGALGVGVVLKPSTSGLAPGRAGTGDSARVDRALLLDRARRG